MKMKNKYVGIILLLLLLLIPVQSIKADRIIGKNDKIKVKIAEEISQEASSEEVENTTQTDSPDAEEKPARIKVDFQEYAAEESKSEMYLKAGKEVKIVIADEEFDSDHTHVILQSIDYAKGQQIILQAADPLIEDGGLIEDITEDILKGVSWKNDGIKHTLSFSFKEEGHYRLLIFTDHEGEIYRSPLLTIDETEPCVEDFFSDQSPIFQKGGYDYYEKYPTYTLIVAEENFNAKRFHLNSGENSVEMSSWKSYYEDGVRKNKMTFTVKKEGCYDIFWEATDGRGLKVTGACHFIIDHSAPKISISNDSANDLLFYHYEKTKIFSKRSIPFCLWAEDQESGIESITYVYWNKEGKVMEKTLESGSFSKIFSPVVSLNLDDFQGWISMKAVNGRGLICDEIRSDDFLWESKATHNKTSRIKLNVGKAIYTDEKSKIKYYREKPEIIVEGFDGYSGIAKSYVKARFGDDQDKDEKKYSGEKDILYQFKQNYVISFPHMNLSNGKKPIQILAGFQDNAGHMTKIDDFDYALVVDGNKPEIAVSYDLNQENSIYKDTRTATVSVEDPNLNLDSIRWKIKGPGDGYEIGTWQKEGKKYCCQVVFSGDGSYQLSLSLSDYADNVASFCDKDSFIIDKTVPQVQLWMDEKDLCYEKYYNTAKSIYVMVKDEHVKPEGIEVYSGKRRLVLDAGMKTRGFPGNFLENMQENGWKVYLLKLERDGVYSLQVSCMDQAGNLSDKVKMSSFIIDQKPPEVSFEHLKEQICYTDQINPKILMNDNYLDQKECRVEICKADGARIDFLHKKIIRASGRTSSVFHIEDFPRKQQYDNNYLLKISAKDLAGNEKVSEIPFSVNRFGVRYYLTKESKKYLETYYHKEEKDITVKAYSLNPLATDVIMTGDQGEIVMLKEEDYVKESHQIKDKDEILPKTQGRLPSDMTGWYETTYQVPKDYFSEEGSYEIALRSKERCLGENQWLVKESENIMWTEPIQFAIDKTPPKVEIGGLDDTVYTSNRHEYTITAMDNCQIKRLRLHVKRDGSDHIEDYDERDFDSMHRITAELTSSSGYQTVNYEAWDQAGNYITNLNSPLEKKVLVTEQPMIEEMKKRSYGILIGIVMAFIGLLLLTRHRFFAILKNDEKK